MRGRIAFINPVTRTGLIYGSDRKRYQFPLTNWEGAALPPRNLEVSFAIRDFEAFAVQPFTGEEPEQEIFMPAPAAPASTSARNDFPPIDTASVEAFRDEDEFSRSGDGEFAEDDPYMTVAPEPLESGEAFPELVADAPPRPQMGKLLFTEPDGASSRPPWKFYAAGLAATLLLILIGFLVTHFL